MILVGCYLAALTVIPTTDVPYDYIAAYSNSVIWVHPDYHWDAGVMYHEIGHHFYYQCDADEHPYWQDKPERFASAWAEQRLGYDVNHYEVPWIDAQWMRWWAELRFFEWK